MAGEALSPDAKTLDVSTFLGGLKLTRFHIFLITISSFVTFFVLIDARLVLANVVDRADIGMRQGGEHGVFAPEAGQRIWFPGESVGEHLHGDVALEARVPCAVDLPHSTRAQF